MFIVIEGLDGSGKTTLIENLGVELSKLNQTFVSTKCPGGATTSLRQILLSKNNLNWKTKLLLFLADQVETIDKIIQPALKEVNFVIADRFVFSSIAYACLDSPENTLEILNLTQSIVNPALPDLIVHLDLDKDSAKERLEVKNHLDETALDNFDNLRQIYGKVYKSLGVKPLQINSKVFSPEAITKIVLNHLNL